VNVGSLTTLSALDVLHGGRSVVVGDGVVQVLVRESFVTIDSRSSDDLIDGSRDSLVVFSLNDGTFDASSFTGSSLDAVDDTVSSCSNGTFLFESKAVGVHG